MPSAGATDSDAPFAMGPSRVANGGNLQTREDLQEIPKGTPPEESSSALDPLPAAVYVLEWGPHRRCTRSPLDVAVGSSGASGAAVQASSPAASRTSISAAAGVLRREWHIDGDASSSSPTAVSPHAPLSGRLFVVRDTGNSRTNRIICSALEMDPAFVAAHTARQRYRPLDRSWRVRSNAAPAASAISYTYPEVLTLVLSRPGRAGPRPQSLAQPHPEHPLETEQAAAPVADEGGSSSTTVDTNVAVGAAATTRTATADAQVNVSSSEATRISLASAGAGAGAGDVKTPAEMGQTVSHAHPAPTSRMPASSKTATSETTIAVFCRASLWTGSCADVLLLDSSPSSTNLEDLLNDALDDTVASDAAVDSTADTGSAAARNSTAANALCEVIAELVYDQWLDFFDTANASTRLPVNKRMLWDMGQHLEQNLVVSRALEKRRNQQAHVHMLQMQARALGQSVGNQSPDAADMLPAAGSPTTSPADWQALLGRLERTVAMLSMRQPKRLPGSMHKQWTPMLSADPSFAITTIATANMDGTVTRSPAANGLSFPPQNTDPANAPFSSSEEGHAALSRVTYMGGILLPFSIVAGVLSMSEPFGPGNNLFWVYWAITIPLTVFSVLVIYADTIRKIEVWVEVASDNVQEALAQGESISVAAGNATLAADEATAQDGSALSPDAEIDLDVEAEAAASAGVRRADRRRGGRSTSVRVHSNPGTPQPTFYRLSDPPSRSPARAARTRTTVSASLPIKTEAGFAPDMDNKPTYGFVEVQGAKRRRFGIPKLASIFARSQNMDAPSTFPPTAGQRKPAGSPYPGDEEAGLGTGGSGDLLGGTGGGPEASVDAPPITEAYGMAGGPPIVIFQRAGDGSQAKAWRRQKMGWYGAAKSIVGYKKPQRIDDSFPVDASAFQSRKTRTF